MEYSEILAGLAVAGGIAAIIGAGAIMAAPGFARWLTDKVATFFEDSQDDSPHDDLIEGHRYYCPNCDAEFDYDDALHSAEVGYCLNCANEWGEH